MNKSLATSLVVLYLFTSNAAFSQDPRPLAQQNGNDIVDGWLVDSDGEGVAGLRVEVQAVGQEPVATTTSATGWYSLKRNSKATYRIFFVDAKRQTYDPTVMGEFAGNKRSRVSVVMYKAGETRPATANAMTKLAKKLLAEN